MIYIRKEEKIIMSKEDVDIYNMYGKDSSISKNEFLQKKDSRILS